MSPAFGAACCRWYVGDCGNALWRSSSPTDIVAGVGQAAAVAAAVACTVPVVNSPT